MRRRTRAGSRSARASSTCPSTIRSCSPGGSPRSTSCPAGGSASGSVRHGPSTSWRPSGPTRKRARRGPTSSSGSSRRCGRRIPSSSRASTSAWPVDRRAQARPEAASSDLSGGLRGGGAPAGGHLADGWLPSSLPIAAIGQMAPQLHALARQAGRDPGRLEVIYMAGARSPARPSTRRSAALSAAARAGARRRRRGSRDVGRHRGHRLERRRDTSTAIACQPRAFPRAAG